MTISSLIFRPLRVAAPLALCGLSSMAIAAPPDMTAGQMPDLKAGELTRTINLGPTGLRG